MTLKNPVNEPEPVWELARLFPSQGRWEEEDYLALDANLLIEFSAGRLEILPMPTTSHQLIVQFLSVMLGNFVSSGDLGTVLFAPLPVRTHEKEYREPDVFFMLRKHSGRIHENYWNGADLVMEVMSEGRLDRQRDLVQKRREYARAGITEYWIIDPREKRISVLKLRGARYEISGEYASGQAAASTLLKGFEIEVDAVFLAASSGKSRKR